MEQSIYKAFTPRVSPKVARARAHTHSHTQSERERERQTISYSVNTVRSHVSPNSHHLQVLQHVIDFVIEKERLDKKLPENSIECVIIAVN